MIGSLLDNATRNIQHGKGRKHHSMRGFATNKSEGKHCPLRDILGEEESKSSKGKKHYGSLEETKKHRKPKSKDDKHCPMRDLLGDESKSSKREKHCPVRDIYGDNFEGMKRCPVLKCPKMNSHDGSHCPMRDVFEEGSESYRECPVMKDTDPTLCPMRQFGHKKGKHCPMRDMFESKKGSKKHCPLRDLDSKVCPMKEFTVKGKRCPLRDLDVDKCPMKLSGESKHRPMRGAFGRKKDRKRCAKRDLDKKIAQYFHFDSTEEDAVRAKESAKICPYFSRSGREIVEINSEFSPYHAKGFHHARAHHRRGASTDSDSPFLSESDSDPHRGSATDSDSD